MGVATLEKSVLDLGGYDMLQPILYRDRLDRDSHALPLTVIDGGHRRTYGLKNAMDYLPGFKVESKLVCFVIID